MPFAYANLERQQVAFPHRPLIDVDVDGIPSTFLIVHRIMLDVANHVLSLRSANDRSDHPPREDRVLTHVLKRPSIARLAGEVHTPAERHVVTLRAQLATDKGSILVPSVQVPARRCAQIAGQSCGVSAVLSTAPDTVSFVRHLDRGNPQTRTPHHTTPPHAPLPRPPAH